MFGIIVSGRPPILDSFTLSETQLAFSIPGQPAFHHIVIFLLPGQTFPGAPDANTKLEAQAWIQLSPTEPFALLGALTAEKPSAVFRVKNNVKQIGDVVSVGIELKPQDASSLATQQTMDIEAGEAATNSSHGSKYSVEDVKSITDKILQSQQDYFASFDNIRLPVNAVKTWKEKFFLRLEHNPAAVGFEHLTSGAGASSNMPTQHPDSLEEVD